MEKRRSRYESHKDLKSEREIAREVLSFFRATSFVQFNGPYSKIDLLLTRGRLNPQAVVLLEAKDRERLPFDRYPEYEISIRKITDGLRISKMQNVPFWLAIRFKDRITRLVQIEPPLTYRRVMGGRDDRGDKYDREPCFRIPISDFVPVTGVATI